ncbi:MAG: hypothetical protein HY731_02390 [Candidatus Tectomicrobia bacterium]|nr:hypothetical protein [Candidatus Tectomicrobia bacterium]
MSKWKKKTLKLKKNHTWRAKAGYRIFVADRGAVRFSFPQDWIVEPDSDSTKFYDGKPPNDNCRLACSYIRLPPIDWSGLPLSQLIQVAVEGDYRSLVATGKFIQVQREDIELAWAEFSFIDPTEHREAFTRVCIGRGLNIQTLITFDYWPEDAIRFSVVWDEVMRSLELGRYVKDPTIGDIIH